jgi:TusE/DsrC/DsvC family sulfur relay protein
MGMFTADDKTYEVDDRGFLVDTAHWTEGFAEGMASQLKIPGPLTTEHWNIIRYIRGTYDETGVCPTVYDTCRMNGLRLKDLRSLFPTGYVRGACLLAGITYRESHHGYAYQLDAAVDLNTISVSKTYETDVRGFLVYPDEWDEYFAAFRAHDMKIPGGKLTDRHWQIIRYLRKIHESEQRIPTVYETCEANDMELDELEQLFPDGYHRGAVKIAGLRLR